MGVKAAGTPAAPPSGWGCYILRCADGSLYTGITNNLARRIRQHNGGRGARYTRSRCPVVVVYWEASPDRAIASQREYALKRLSREAKLALIKARPGPAPA